MNVIKVVFTFALLIVYADARRPGRYRSRGSSGGRTIVLQAQVARPVLVDPNNNYDEKIQKMLIQASNISRVSDFLNVMGIKQDADVIGSRKTKIIAENAVCEPEVRTVDLDAGNSGDAIMFPKCVNSL
ncbi:hypothetical protein B4U80_09085 [Leptotrombidium deliense]|uniref:Uncharacterized protein n=1 Tax=Leptotrombidium deliense TaxID=299467 RepID=A0A443SGI1_9ACAR|nr:hypothetical protein B4U80_09085 [Leptotrombidium deliense]